MAGYGAGGQEGTKNSGVLVRMWLLRLMSRKGLELTLGVSPFNRTRRRGWEGLPGAQKRGWWELGEGVCTSSRPLGAGSAESGVEGSLQWVEP